jgi:hypothetical protein
MAASTLRQRKQQALSWKLRMVMGARGTLYPRERDIPEHIKQALRNIDTELLLVEAQLRKALANIL